MAIVWADGFDHWGAGNTANMLAGGYQTVDGGPVAGAGRTGSFACDGNGNHRRVLNASATKLGVCLAMYHTQTSGVAGVHVISLEKAVGTSTVDLQFNGDLSVSILNNGVVVGTSAPNTWLMNTYQQWEIKADMSGAAGTHSIAVRLNGNTTAVLTVTGLTIIGPFVSVNFQTGTHNTKFDDFVIWDGTGINNNDWLGDRKCVTLFPSANGALQQWTPNAGTAWSNINAVPPGANYISSSTTGDVSEFAHDTLPIATASIAAIQIYAAVLKTTAGSAAYRIGMNKAGIVQNSPAINPGTTISFGQYIMEVDPDGLAWTRTVLDAAAIRITRDL